MDVLNSSRSGCFVFFCLVAIWKFFALLYPNCVGPRSEDSARHLQPLELRILREEDLRISRFGQL